jgi:predicted nuclease with TOPRIM domain
MMKSDYSFGVVSYRDQVLLTKEIVEFLTAMRTTLDERFNRLDSALNDLTERVDRIEVRLSVLEEHISRSLAAQAVDRSVLTSLEQRVRRIEKRLQMTDDDK